MTQLPTFEIRPVMQDQTLQIQARIDSKTKPPGALGALEALALAMARIQNDEHIRIEKPVMIVFAGDHGIAKQGVSIAPSEVTQQMVMNFLQGGAAINCFCRSSGMALEVVDAGILSPIEHADLCAQRLGAGTEDFSQAPAMSFAQAVEGVMLGAKVARKHVKMGSSVIGFGEMGIGNTSSAAALMAASLGLTAEVCVGRGTGVDDSTLARKRQLIDQALALHAPRIAAAQGCAVTRLACLGGFEIVQMVGAMLAAAEAKMIILVDGFIATVAARYAIELYPASRDYMVFCHQSGEQGHAALLASMAAQPLLDLGLRLGEGTGAALALPLIQAAAGFYNDMASFEQAGIADVG